MKYKVITCVVSTLESRLNELGKFGWTPVHFEFTNPSVVVVFYKERDENGFA